MITFRPINIETDAADLARLYSATVPEPVTTDTIRDMWAPRKDEIHFTTLAFDGDQAIGYWEVDRETWMRPGHWWVKVVIAPTQRGRGLGARMYVDARAVAQQQGATHLESKVREDAPHALHFARKHGFRVEFHAFELTIDLTIFDEKRFAPLLERVHGFRFFSLAEAGITEENKHKLYEVNRASALDNPGNGGVFSDFEAFSMNVFNASWFRADTQILAADGKKWVGLSAISIDEEQRYSYNAFTGVLREYRGRGLAQALKLQTILLAKRAGMRYIRTDNDSQNAPMLAINRKLGYQPETGIFRLLCELKR